MSCSRILLGTVLWLLVQICVPLLVLNGEGSGVEPLARPFRILSTSLLTTVCDLLRTNGARITGAATGLNPSFVSLLKKECNDPVARARRTGALTDAAPSEPARSPTPLAVADSGGTNSSAQMFHTRVRTRPSVIPADRYQKSMMYQNNPPKLPIALSTPATTFSSDEEDESDDDDLASLIYDAYSSPPQTSTFSVGLIDPFKALPDMIESNFNESMFRTMNQWAEKLNQKLFPNLYPTPKLEANSPKMELPDKSEESEKQNVPRLGTEIACCPFASEAVDVADESQSVNDTRLLQEPTTVEPVSVSNDQIKFEEKEIEDDKTNTPSTLPNQEPPYTSQPAPAEMAKPVPGNIPIEMQDHESSEEQIRIPASAQPVSLGVAVSDAVNRAEPLVGNVMLQVPIAQQAIIPIRASESVSVNEVPVIDLPLAKTQDHVVYSASSIVEPPTNGVMNIRKEPELNDSEPSNTFIGSSSNTLVRQTPGPANPIDVPVSVEANPPIQPPSDQSANAPNDPTPDVKSEATVGQSNVQNNTGMDWWDCLVPLLVVAGGVALGYGIYRRVKKTQTQPPTSLSSTDVQGYSRVNDPNGTALF
jgi:hypothetical protein